MPGHLPGVERRSELSRSSSSIRLLCSLVATSTPENVLLPTHTIPPRLFCYTRAIILPHIHRLQNSHRYCGLPKLIDTILSRSSALPKLRGSNHLIYPESACSSQFEQAHFNTDSNSARGPPTNDFERATYEVAIAHGTLTVQSSGTRLGLNKAPRPVVCTGCDCC